MIRIVAKPVDQYINEDHIEDCEYFTRGQMPFIDCEVKEQIKDVIVELCFQIGVRGFSKFRKTIGYASSGDWINMSTEMLDSKWARSDSPNRAKALSDRVAGVIDD